MKPINIVHLYPKEMNIYGDNGNILVIKKRLEWRGYSVNVVGVGIGQAIPANSSIIIGGGGQDSGQSVIAKDLQGKASILKSMSASGVPMLMICGMYQMFGHYFRTADNKKIPGIGVLDITTVASEGRLIGNIVVESSYGKLVGYENHSGLTSLGSHARPIGTTKLGQGNNGLDGLEGAVQNNVYGSYLHGPLLAKSPEFTDMLIAKALANTGQHGQLTGLPIDTLAHESAQIAAARKR
jgi:lipid II isoglutaminyl synthase (glutamine-hydrolysing)